MAPNIAVLWPPLRVCALFPLVSHALVSHAWNLWQLFKPVVSRRSQQPSCNHHAAWLPLQGLDVGDACEVKPTNKLLTHNVKKGGGGPNSFN